ncbi:hypothetical protein [Streptomyces phaeoluteigriseus]|uniref:hypothetical protein n=1 Tax=Streptomyces phaeoluteigriseus TaxID=114686 RepID=UPI0036A88BE0
MPRAGAAGAGRADGAGVTVVACTDGAAGAAGAGTGAGPATGTTAAGRSTGAAAGAGAGADAGVDVRWSSRPPDRPSRTAGDGEPVKEGFRQVARRLPKPASATPVVLPPATARCTGGSVDQAAGRRRTGTGSVPASGMSGPGPDAGAPPPAEGSVGRRKRSRKPIAQSSARVTRDAMLSV